MDTNAKPIVATTSLSFLLHGVAFAGVLLAYEQVVMKDEGVGRGVEIQLVSSMLVSDQQEVDVARKQELAVDDAPESLMNAAQKKFAEKIMTSLHSTQAVVARETEDKSLFDHEVSEQQHVVKQTVLSDSENESVAVITQSTNASQDQHAILELLHQRISENKEYPYLARRQRREGIATVAFVLHPDGSIENARLISSSHAQSLDYAALSAVKQIEPFNAAHEYLKQSEAFQVDVAFDLL